MSDSEFDTEVKRYKAGEWLIMNDVIVRAVVSHMQISPLHAVLYAAKYGAEISSKLNQTAEQMTVTDLDRAEGYPRDSFGDKVARICAIHIAEQRINQPPADLSCRSLDLGSADPACETS